MNPLDIGNPAAVIINGDQNMAAKNDHLLKDVTLNGLVTQAEAWDATFSEIPLDAQDLKFHPEGILHHGELHRLIDEKRKHLFEKAGA